MPDLSPDTNFTQIHLASYAARPFRVVCAWCGRAPGLRDSCDGCGAPACLESFPPIIVRRRGLPHEEDFVYQPGKIVRARQPDDVHVFPYGAIL